MFTGNEKPILEIPDHEEDELDFDDDEVFMLIYSYQCLLFQTQQPYCGSGLLLACA